MWPEYGYFGQVACSIQLEKQNMPDNSLFYLNQGRLSNKGSKKIFYGDYFKPDFRTFKNPPSDSKTHVFNECEVLIYGPKYDLAP